MLMTNRLVQLLKKCKHSPQTYINSRVMGWGGVRKKPVFLSSIPLL